MHSFNAASKTMLLDIPNLFYGGWQNNISFFASSCNLKFFPMTMFICERGDIVIIFRKMFGSTSVIRLIYNYSTVLFMN